MDNAEYAIRHGHDSASFIEGQHRTAVIAERRRLAARYDFISF